MSCLLEGEADPRCPREDTQGRERPGTHGWASSGNLSWSWRGNKCKLTQHASTHSFTLESGNFCPRGISAGTEHVGVTLNQVEAVVWQPRCPAARGKQPPSPNGSVITVQSFGHSSRSCFPGGIFTPLTDPHSISPCVCL